MRLVAKQADREELVEICVKYILEGKITFDNVPDCLKKTVRERVDEHPAGVPYPKEVPEFRGC